MAHVARVVVVNPSGRRTKERKAMAKAKRRKKRRAASNPKKTRTRKKRRAVAAPTRKKRRASSPKRSSTRRRRRAAVRTSGRRRASNPSRRRRFGRRRHRRNPGLPLFAQAGLAAGLAVLTFAGVTAGSYAATQRLDPTLATTTRNRSIASAVALLAGIALAVKKSPLFGLAVAAGGAVAGVGPQLGIKLTAMLQPKQPSSVPIAGYEPMGQVYGQIAGYEPMGQVYGNLGAIVDGAELAPAPPWQSANPFN